MNSEKNFTNKSQNLYIDAGNQLLKVGYQVNDKWIIKKIPNTALKDEFAQTLSSFRYTKIYWASVCKTSTTFLNSFFTQHHIDNNQITASDFQGKLLINDKIDINEVGVDILAYCYYIRLQPKTLALSFGTATVAIYYNMQLEGVVIGTDFVNSYSYLDDILGIDGHHVMMQDDFGTNTIDAVNGAKYYMVNGFINELLANKTIEQIYVSGGNKNIFNIYKNINHKHIEIVDEIVLKGLEAFINRK